MTDAPLGVLLMSYGTPSGPGEIEAYYTHVRRGRPPTPEQLADLRRRYDAIGGVSPLARLTRRQADGISAALERRAPGRYRVAVGAKHAAPFIEDGVRALAAAGVRRTVAVVLAPHYSAMSVGEYMDRARAEAGPAMEVVPVSHWHLHPELVIALARRLREATATVAAPPEETQVLFTAHSLPERILAEGDPYPEQLRETAGAVAAEARTPRWAIAWQSAGRTPEPWIGPDVLAAIGAAAGEGAKAVVVCPAGFTSDHLEVLYDLEVEAAAAAAGAGVAFARTRSLNDDPRLCSLLADVVEAAANGADLAPLGAG